MVFVADDALPFIKHCMKPYDQKNLSYEERVFHYHCPPFQRIGENAFGVCLVGLDYLQHVLR